MYQALTGRALDQIPDQPVLLSAAGRSNRAIHAPTECKAWPGAGVHSAFYVLFLREDRHIHKQSLTRNLKPETDSQSVARLEGPAHCGTPSQI